MIRTQADFLDTFAAFADALGVSVSAVGREHAGQSTLYERLRAGSSITLRRHDELIAKFAALWPDGHERPAYLKEWEEANGGSND